MFRRMPGEKNKSWSVSLKRFPFFSGCIVKVVVLTVVLLTTTKIQAQLYSAKRTAQGKIYSQSSIKDPVITSDTMISAKTIDDLPAEKLTQFDQAYKEFLSAQKTLMEFDKKIREGDTPLGIAFRRKLNLKKIIDAGSSEQNILFSEVKKKGSTINESHDSFEKLKRWSDLTKHAAGSRIRQKLSEDKEFQPLLAWWAESIFTDGKLNSQVFPEDIKGLIPQDHATNPKTKLTREEYLAIYLTMWKRHSKRYENELKVVKEESSYPSAMSKLVINQFDLGLQWGICRAFIPAAMPGSEFAEVYEKYFKTAKACSAIWLEWFIYHGNHGGKETGGFESKSLIFARKFLAIEKITAVSPVSIVELPYVKKVVPLHLKGIVTVNAETIDDLPPKTRSQFDQAYKEFIVLQIKVFEESQKIKYADNLYQNSIRIRSAANQDTQTIKQEIKKLPDGWDIMNEANIRKKAPAKARWKSAFFGASAFINIQKLSEDKEFQPLLIWWAKYLLTLDPPTMLCGNEYLEGLLSKDGAENAKRKLTQEEYLDIYLTAWERYSKRHLDELETEEKKVSVPSELPELLSRWARNNIKDIVCTTYKQIDPLKMERIVDSKEYFMASEKCSAIWPQWYQYYKKLREKREAEEEILIQQIREMKRISRQKKRVPN